MTYTDNPVLFVVVIALATLLVMYLFRIQAQRLIEQFFRILQKQFRLLSKVCAQSEQRVRLRHYEVTKALVEVLTQRRVDRSYGYIEKMVRKELAYYKLKADRVNGQLDNLETDYKASAQIPPPSPDWVAAVEAIAQIESDERNSDVMVKILADMHNTIQLHQQDAMREHRWSVSSRHKLLVGLEPQWKKLGQLIAAAERKSDMLQHKIRRLDQEMCRYELLTSGNGQGFMASILARFTIAVLLMTLSAMVGYYNSQLLLLPFVQQAAVEMSLSLPILAMHSAMLVMASVLLCESVGATHMLPFLASLQRAGKIVLAVIAGAVIIALSALSASWAGGFQSSEALLQGGINQWSLAIMSFFACWLFAAIVMPLEYAVQTLRPVLSSFLQLLLFTAGVTFRVLASLSVELGRLCMRLYDAIIFIPLSIERRFDKRHEQTELKSMDIVNAEPQASIEPTTLTYNEEEIDCSNVTQIHFGASSKKS